MTKYKFHINNTKKIIGKVCKIRTINVNGYKSTVKIDPDVGIFSLSRDIWQVHFESKMFQWRTNNVYRDDIFRVTLFFNSHVGYNSLGHRWIWRVFWLDQNLFVFIIESSWKWVFASNYDHCLRNFHDHNVYRQDSDRPLSWSLVWSVFYKITEKITEINH